MGSVMHLKEVKVISQHQNMIRVFRIFVILQSFIAASITSPFDEVCCCEVYLQQTISYPEAQGHYYLMNELHAGHPVYIHETGDYYIYKHETFENWHIWVEIGSMYAGFVANGDDTKCPSEAVWYEMIDGKWVRLPLYALTCGKTCFTTTTTTTTTTTDFP